MHVTRAEFAALYTVGPDALYALFQEQAAQLAALTARLPSIDNLADPRWTAGLRLQDHGGSVPRLVKALGARTWSPFHGDLTEAQLAEAARGGRFLLQFASKPGNLYAIEYMNDFPAGEWVRVPLRLLATANQTQWIDSGPPATEPPSGLRAYRARRTWPDATIPQTQSRGGGT